MGAIKENLIYNIENIVNKMDELGLFDYEEAENEALFEDIQVAINYQMDQEKIYNMVYDQMIKNFFYKFGKKYNALDEFIENGIC